MSTVSVSNNSGPSSTLGVWVLATRPKTLPAAFAPIFVGAALASILGAFQVLPTLLALVSAVLLQIVANFANDVFDYEKGADTEERVGPTRAVASGLIPPASMKIALWVTLGLATLTGGWLVRLAGSPVLVIGVISMVVAIAYTGGPYPLGYHGLGDVAVMIVFGFFGVCGTVYVNVGFVPPTAWWASAAMGSLSTAILVVNNVRDIETDSKAGKRTLAVRFGRDWGVAEYRLLLVVAFLTPPLMVFLQILEPMALLPLVLLPRAYRLQTELAKGQGSALNETLAKTALLVLQFGTLLTLGLVLSAALLKGSSF